MEDDQYRFYGKYRGLVTDNKDPDILGRIKVKIPAIPGLADNWANPCSPYAGDDVGFYAIPPVGALVWVEFEGGNVNQPIWVGCFWDDGEVPSEVKATNQDDPAQIKVFKTRVCTFWVNDTDKKGHVILKFNDTTVDEPITITFTLDSEKLNIKVEGSKGTSTIDQTPVDIITNSETLQTNTTKDTTMKADKAFTAEATKAMTLKSTTDAVTVQAQKDLTAKATQNVSIQATKDATMKATANATVQGTAKATLKGPQVEVNGSGMVTIKGAMVKIN